MLFPAFRWTIYYLDFSLVRKKATLRTSLKKGRVPQKVVAVFYSYSASIFESVEKVVYYTGLEKRGVSLIVGGD